MKKLKCMISLLLCAVMVFGLMPSAFALGGEAEQAQVIEPAAQIEMKEAAEAEKLAAVLPGEAPAAESEEELEEEEAAEAVEEEAAKEEEKATKAAKAEGVLTINKKVTHDDASGHIENFLEQYANPRSRGYEVAFRVYGPVVNGEVGEDQWFRVTINDFKRENDGSWTGSANARTECGTYWIVEETPRQFNGFTMTTKYGGNVVGEKDHATVNLIYEGMQDELPHASCSITNTYTGNGGATGDIEILKTFEGLAKGDFPEDFRMELEITRDDLLPLKTRDGETASVTYDAKTEKFITNVAETAGRLEQLTDGRTGYIWTLNGVPTGSYDIREYDQDVEGYYWTLAGVGNDHWDVTNNPDHGDYHLVPDNVVKTGEKTRVTMYNYYAKNGTTMVELIKEIRGVELSDLKEEARIVLTPYSTHEDELKKAEAASYPYYFGDFEYSEADGFYHCLATGLPAGSYFVGERDIDVPGYSLGPQKMRIETVDNDKPHTVKVINDYYSTMGSLAIIKEFKGISTDIIPASLVVDITNEEDSSLNRTVVLSTTEGGEGMAPDDVREDNLAFAWIIEKVPTGTYTVTEKAESVDLSALGYTLKTTYKAMYKDDGGVPVKDVKAESDSNTVVVRESSEPSMWITNTYTGIGDVVITKTFTGLPSRLFPVDFRMYFEPVLEAVADEENNEEEVPAARGAEEAPVIPMVWYEADSDRFFTNMTGEGCSVETVTEDGRIVGFVWTIANCPTGEYEIAEAKADIGDYHAQMTGPNSVVVKVGDNEFDIENQYAHYERRLIITKKIVGLPDGTLPEDLFFVVEPHHESVPIKGEDEVKPTFVEIPFSDFTPVEGQESVYVYTLTDDEIVPGTYDIFEVDPEVNGYWLNNEVQGATVEVTEEGTFQVTITNVYERMYGSLMIDKVVSGDLTPAEFLEKTGSDVEFKIEGPADFGENGVMTINLKDFDKDSTGALVYYSQNPNGYRIKLTRVPVGIYTVTEAETGDHSAEVENYALNVGYQRGVYIEKIPVNPPIEKEEYYKEEYKEQVRKAVKVEKGGAEQAESSEAERPDWPGELEPISLLMDNQVEVGIKMLGTPYMKVTNDYDKGAEVTVVKQFTGLPDGVYPENFRMSIVKFVTPWIDPPEKKAKLEEKEYASEALPAELAEAAELKPGIPLFAGPAVWYDAEEGCFKTNSGELTETEDGYVWTLTLGEGDYFVEEYGCNMTDYEWIFPETMPGFNVEFGKPVTVTVVNEYEARKVDLTVTKAFSGLDEDQIPADTLFTVTDKDGKEVASFTYGDMTNGEYVVRDLPVGEYTVTETPVEIPGYDRLTSFDVQSNDKWSVALTKTITNVPDDGVFRPGETINYRISLYNNGTEPIYKPWLEDSLMKLEADIPNPLMPGSAPIVIETSYTIPSFFFVKDVEDSEQIVNTVMFYGLRDIDDPDSEMYAEASATADVDMTVAARINISPRNVLNPRTGTKIPFDVTVRNTGKDPIVNGTVTVTINGEKITIPGVDLAVGKEARFTAEAYDLYYTVKSSDHSVFARAEIADSTGRLLAESMGIGLIVNQGGVEEMEEKERVPALRGAKAGDSAGAADQLSCDVTLSYASETEISIKNNYYPSASNDKARLYVTKIVELPEGERLNPRYSIDVEITDARTDKTYTVTLGDFNNNKCTAYIDLDPGTYYVEELEKGLDLNGLVYVTRYDPADEDGSGRASVTLTGGGTQYVEITNVYSKGGLVVLTKTFDGLNAELNEGFTLSVVPDTDEASEDAPSYTVTYKDGKFDTEDGSVEITEDGFVWTFAAEPGDYTVTENGQLVEGYDFRADFEPFTVKALETSEVSVENVYTRQTGYLQISKEFKGLAAGQLPRSLSFQISGPDDFETLTIPYSRFTDGVWGMTVPVGTYTVKEIGGDVGGYTFTTTANGDKGTTATVTVRVKTAENIPAKAEFVNTYTAQGGGDDPVPPALNGDDHFAYVIGYPDGCVHPEAEITRAEAATIFFRLLREGVRNAYWSETNDFSDVSEGQWFNHAISTLAKMGIVSGYPDGTFKPGETITRAEFASMAARFDAKNGYPTADFSDVAGHWAEVEIAKAAANGWINGYPDGSFQPDRKINRAEAMALVNRVLNRDPAHPDDLLKNMITWPDNMDKNAWFYLDVQEATNSHTYERVTKPTEKWVLLEQPRDWAALEY